MNQSHSSEVWISSLPNSLLMLSVLHKFKYQVEIAHLSCCLLFLNSNSPQLPEFSQTCFNYYLHFGYGNCVLLAVQVKTTLILYDSILLASHIQSLQLIYPWYILKIQPLLNISFCYYLGQCHSHLKHHNTISCLVSLFLSPTLP